MGKVRCRACKDIIESTHVHNWVCCSCFTNRKNTTGIFVDGGNDYLRVGGNLKNIEIINDARKKVVSK